MKKYIKNSSDEDYFNKLIKRIDEDGYTCFIIQTTGEDDYWYWVIDTPIVEESGLTDEEFINSWKYSAEGGSVASFDTAEEAESDFRGDNSQSVESTKSVTASAELDDRFDFLLDPEFEIYLNTLAKPVPCYVVSSDVFGDGAGMSYVVAVAVPSDKAHWQIRDDIERNLSKHMEIEVDGSDYTASVEETPDGYTYGLPSSVPEDCEVYFYDVVVVSYQNIDPYGEYGIDFGTKEYTDHLTEGTPWPPEYED